MQLRHRVALGGVQLDEIDPSIIIKGVEEAAGKDTVGAVSTATRDGQRVTGRRRDTLDVTVRFGINLRRDQLQRRSDVFELVNAWAAPGGVLTVNYKKGRRLRVVCVQAPGAGDMWKRTNEYTITFRAYAVPYWEQATAISAQTGTGSSGSAQLTVEGSAETVAEVTLANKSGALIQTATITIGGKVMKFEALGLAGNESLVIDYTNDAIQRIRIRNASGSFRSAMISRIPASSVDDFKVSPGVVSCSFTAQRACQMTVSARGRFV
jgi:hypothetical protein